MVMARGGGAKRRGVRLALHDHMRRFRIFFGCSLAVILALPLLPGPGWLIVAEALAVLEQEFPWVRRRMDRLARTGPAGTRPDSRRSDSMPHAA